MSATSRNPSLGLDPPIFHKGSARMFNNDVLEKLSRVHPAMPAVLFLPVIALSLWTAFARDRTAGVGAAAWQFSLGYLGWTLIEYWLHRVLFHLPVRGPLTQRVHFFVHGVHWMPDWFRPKVNCGGCQRRAATLRLRLRDPGRLVRPRPCLPLF